MARNILRNVVEALSKAFDFSFHFMGRMLIYNVSYMVYFTNQQNEIGLIYVIDN